MMLMAERHRLIAHHAGPGHVIGADELGPRPTEQDNQEHAPEDTDLGEHIETAVENLGHGAALHSQGRPRSPHATSSEVTRRNGKGRGLPVVSTAWEICSHLHYWKRCGMVESRVFHSLSV